MPLKYLFTVEYKSGSTYHQNEEDKSVVQPETRSCFFDVDPYEVKTFTLNGEGHSYSVHLDDPHFEIDGVRQDEEPLEEGLTDFRAIFWRKHKVSVLSNGDNIDEIYAYQIGWQANDKDGRNVQRTMDIE